MIVNLECIVPDGTTPANGSPAVPYVQHLDGETETTKIDGTTVVLPAIPSNTDVTFNLHFYGQNKIAFPMTGYTALLTSRRTATAEDPVFANEATIDGSTTNLMTAVVSRDQTADEGTRTDVYDVLILKTATDKADRVIPQSHMRMEQGITDPDAAVTPATTGSAIALLGSAQTFTKAQNVAAVALTDGATIATDASLSNVFTVTLGGNRTLSNPTNLVAGGTYLWVVTQGSGGQTLAYGSLFTWPSGTAPTLSSGSGDVDLISAVYSGGKLRCVAQLDFS